jgi:hypothetical protein
MELRVNLELNVRNVAVHVQDMDIPQRSVVQPLQVSREGKCHVSGEIFVFYHSIVI